MTGKDPGNANAEIRQVSGEYQPKLVSVLMLTVGFDITD